MAPIGSNFFWVGNAAGSGRTREQKRAENYNKWHNKFIFLTEISILRISNHNSFRVLFDNIASVCFVWKIYIYILPLEMASPVREPALCQLYRHIFVPYTGDGEVTSQKLWSRYNRHFVG